MSYLLWGDRRSGSAIVELALSEAEQRFELRDVPLGDHAQRASGYAAINAQRKLPTLITPDGETLTESAAILMILADRHPEAALLPPPGSPEHAQALRWLLFIATEIYPVVEMIDYPERFQPEGGSISTERRSELRAHLRRIWQRRLTLVEHAIAGEPWFLTGGFSGLDIYVAVVSRWAQLDDWRTHNVPRIEAIASALAERPRCRAVWRRHFG